MRTKMRCDSVVENHAILEDPASAKLTETVCFHPIEGEAWVGPPSGSLSLTLTNSPVWGAFKEGSLYVVEITEAPPAA